MDRQSIAEQLRILDPVHWQHAGLVAGYVQAMLQTDSHSSFEIVPAIVDAAWLHDIGKLALPREMLDKAGSLNESEWVDVRRHPDIGADYLAASLLAGEVSDLVRHHHEWHDGRGYPSGLRANSIAPGARLIGVADAYDAMTSWRPYRERLSDQEAIEELRRCAGTQFDPDVVELFVRSTCELRPGNEP